MSKAKTKAAAGGSSAKGKGKTHRTSNIVEYSWSLESFLSLEEKQEKIYLNLYGIFTAIDDISKLSNRFGEMIDASASYQSSLKEFLKHGYEMPKSAFEAINEVLKIGQGDWADILGVPLSRIQSGSRFNHLQSMHILSVLLLYNNGIEVFGNRKKFEKWLDTKNEYYEDVLPKHYLRTPTGINILFEDLVKIEYGFVA